LGILVLLCETAGRIESLLLKVNLFVSWLILVGQSKALV